MTTKHAPDPVALAPGSLTDWVMVHAVLWPLIWLTRRTDAFFPLYMLLAAAQWFALRRTFPLWRRSLLANVWAWLLGLFFGIPLGLLIVPPQDGRFVAASAWIGYWIGAAIIGGIQALVLTRHFRRAWIWALAQIPLFGLLQSISWELNVHRALSGVPSLLAGTVLGLLYGLLSGALLAELAKHPQPQKRPTASALRHTAIIYLALGAISTLGFVAELLMNNRFSLFMLILVATPVSLGMLRLRAAKKAARDQSLAEILGA